MKKVLFSLIFISLISLVSAELDYIKPYECINLRVLSNCSSISLTEVTTGSDTFIINTPMTYLGGQTFNYTFCNTSKIAIYSYSWDDPCKDCSDGTCGNSFEVNSVGKKSNGSIVAFTILILLIIYGMTIFGIAIKQVYVTMLGSMAMMVLGLYIFTNGIIIYKDYLTEYISYMNIGLGVIITAWALWEILDEL